MTTMRLNDRIIVITGGTSGIGQCLARTLRNKNNEVIVLGRAGEKLDRMADEGFATVPCDLGQAGSIEDAAHQVAQRWPRVDVLFNNAGVQYNYDLTSEVLPIGRIHREIDIDLSGQEVSQSDINRVLAGDVVNERTGWRERLDDRERAAVVRNARSALEKMIEITEA